MVCGMSIWGFGGFPRIRRGEIWWDGGGGLGGTLERGTSEETVSAAATVLFISKLKAVQSASISKVGGLSDMLSVSAVVSILLKAENLFCIGIPK